jgi:hypothetical protein
MRFLREMIVRRGPGGAPGLVADEPPVKDFFELSPMRERLARSRAAEAELAAMDPAIDDDVLLGDDAEDDLDVARLVADRLGGGPAGATPRRPAPVVPDAGFDDLEFGTFDDAEIDSFELDAPGFDAADATSDMELPSHDPQLARRPMSAPQDERLVEARAGWGSDEDDPDAVDDLTDDPALAALVAARKPVMDAADEDAGLEPEVHEDSPAESAADEDTWAFRGPGATDDDAILAGIAAALPPTARAALGAVAVGTGAAVRGVVAQPESETAAPDVAAPAVAPRAPRIWDIEAEEQETAVIRFAETAAPPQPAPPQSAAPEAVAAAAAAASIPDPEPLRTLPPRKAGRVRTRLLGFHSAEDAAPDPLAAPSAAPVAGPVRFPVGWVVVTDGPGRGASFTLRAGVSPIGRDEDQTIQLDFGDTAISRQMHAAIAYDEESRGFFLGHGGKSNIVRLNGRPVLSTEDLSDGDMIRIGETTLKFVAFCGKAFDWSEASAELQTGDRADAGN